MFEYVRRTQICLPVKKYVKSAHTEAFVMLTVVFTGEPSTQMTLKTFHFAGVASMNITQVKKQCMYSVFNIAVIKHY